jgi:TadE-like protein
MTKRVTAITESLKRRSRSQQSQGLVEFALIAPVILLLTFGIIDFGRGLYFYITLQQAANEGARVAVRASNFIDPNGVGCVGGVGHCWPTDADVAAGVQGHAITEVLANPCPNGPIPNGGSPSGSAQLPPANTGWIFITDPSPAGDGGGLNVVGSPPANYPVANGPRGGLGSTPAGGPSCLGIKPAVGNEPIKVTIWFTFSPFTPLVQQVVGNRIVIQAYAVLRAEYSN